MGIFKTIEKGVFGGVRRPIDGGKGLAGVFEKDSTYFNPFIPLMLGGIDNEFRIIFNRKRDFDINIRFNKTKTLWRYNE